MPRLQSDRKQRLRAAAAELFHIRGYEAVSIRDIADAANVPVGAVYYYYPSKSAIARSVAEMRYQRISEFLDALNTGEKSPRERLAALTTMMLGIAEQVNSDGCPIARLIAHVRPGKDEHEVAALRIAAQTFSAVLEFVSEQAEALGYPTAQARILAQRYIAIWQGSAVMAMAFAETSHAKALLNSVVDDICSTD